MERILAPLGALCVLATVVLGAWGWMDSGESEEVAERAERARRIEESCGDLVSATSTADYILRTAQVQADPSLGVDPSTLTFELPYLIDTLDRVGRDLSGQTRADAARIRQAAQAVLSRLEAEGVADLSALQAPNLGPALARLQALARQRCPDHYTGIDLGPGATLVPVDPGPTTTVVIGTPPAPATPPPLPPSPSSTTQPGG